MVMRPKSIATVVVVLLETMRVSSTPTEADVSGASVVSVVSIVAGDLVAAGLLEVHQTDPVEIELDMLLRMIERVRAL